MDEPVEYDAYGFAIIQDVEGRCHDYSGAANTEHYNSIIWETVIDKISDDITARITDDSPLFSKLCHLTRQGVPKSVRSKLWRSLLQSDAIRTTSNFDYKASSIAIREQLVDQGISEYTSQCSAGTLNAINIPQNENYIENGHIDVKITRQIMLDLERTYPTHKLFMGNSSHAKEGRAKLFRVLAAYVRYNPRVGYCQGMSFIVGMMLMQMPEEDAFWCCVTLFERRKYLSGYFDHSLARIQQHAGVFEKLLHQRSQQLAEHFERLNLCTLMYIVPWFMCLFTGLPCWDTVLAIWDRIILEGVTTIFSVSLTILENSKQTLLDMHDLTHLMPYLLHVPSDVYDILVKAIWKTKVDKWQISSLSAVVHDESVKSDKEGKMTAKRKRRHESGSGETDNKKRKMSSKDPSIFERFVNLFTPQSQRLLVQCDRTRDTQTQRKHSDGAAPYRSRLRSSMRLSELSTGARYYKQPKCGHRDLNTPSNRTLVSSDPLVQHSFKTFHTPTPLRPSQKRASLLGSPNYSSPVELSGAKIV